MQPIHANVIDVVDLSKKFAHRVAVKNVTMQVQRGEIIGFIGPNGSGKTTTIRMLSGLLKPTSGRGTCLGLDILTQASEIRAIIGYMPQAFSLYKNLTVEENLNFRARLYGLINREQQVNIVIKLLNFEAYRHEITGHLSGGWKQRLALAAAILHDPLLVLLDEPTAGMDPKFQREFWDIVNQLVARGVTFLISSHSLEAVVRCNRIAYMGYGKLLEMGTSKEIISKVGLSSWAVIGSNLPLLANQLQSIPEIEIVQLIADTLYISGHNKPAIEKAIQPYFNHANYQWRQAESTLGDAFAWLISQAENIYEK
jgi:ABC-2 type transport system ATP-binding protein